MKINGLNVISSKDLYCGNCGTCCNVYGLVDLHVTDLFRISEYLGMSPEEFFEQYCIVINDQDGNTAFSMNINGGCMFRADGRCSIYPVRSDTCALYPFNYVCVNLSTAIKKEIACYQQCFVHSLDENMLVVPNIERMIDSRIMFMVREMYLATFDGRFDEAEAQPFHLKGLSLLKDSRMREMVYLKMMHEMMKIVPIKDGTTEPVLSEPEIRAICDRFRE
ncbi:MAG TPA: YkgJ family cysteine cluster protein [Methanocella sp.]|nr:YkgJ family cysteine cluster protein [Methanocella sp.]